MDTLEHAVPQLVVFGQDVLDAIGAAVRHVLFEAGFAEEHVVLISSETHLQPLYPEINTKVVPSLLRNFSAPVILRDDLTSAERLKLLAHDTDMFNRWDAAQTLFADQILATAMERVSE